MADSPADRSVVMQAGRQVCKLAAIFLLDGGQVCRWAGNVDRQVDRQADKYVRRQVC